MPVEPNEKLGREPAATVLSARDLSCSDQLKPCSVGRVKADILSATVLGLAGLTGCAEERAGTAMEGGP